MAGCRNLSDEEITIVINNLKNDRDKALFVLGYTTGFRISELLSITIKDVYDYHNNKISDYVKVYRRNMKGQTTSREMPLHSKAKEHIKKLIEPYTDKMYRHYPLFMTRSNNVKHVKAISRVTAHSVLKQAFKDATLTGTLATHSMRKSFAMKIYKASGNDLMLLQNALGHSSIITTVKYLNNDDEIIKQLIEMID